MQPATKPFEIPMPTPQSLIETALKIFSGFPWWTWVLVAVVVLIKFYGPPPRRRRR